MNSVSSEDVRLFLKEYLTEKLATQGREVPPELTENCDLLLSGIIDSLGLLELVTAIQQYCGREIDFEPLDPEQMTIVGPLCRYVSDQIAQAHQ